MKTIQIFLVFCSMALLFSCSSKLQLMNEGQYATVIKRCSREINRGKINDENVFALQTAFQKANARDMAIVSMLVSDTSRETDWAYVYKQYEQLQDREAKIRALIPNLEAKSHRPSFRFISGLDSLSDAARLAAAQQLYDQGLYQLSTASVSNKKAAQRAYNLMEKAKRKYKPGWAQLDADMARAQELGTTYVLLETQGMFLFNVENKNANFWTVIHKNPQANIHYDFAVETGFAWINVGSDERYVSTSTVSKEIIDHYDIKRDSSGHEISRTAVTKTVNAEIKEIYLSKKAWGSVDIHTKDLNHPNAFTDHRTLNVETEFNDKIVIVSGDERALESVPHGSSCERFPMDFTMSSEVESKLEDEVLRHLSWVTGN